MFEFVLGIVASIVASFLITWFILTLSYTAKKKTISLLKNPILFFKLKINSTERDILKVITGLFESWENKDVNNYSSFWLDNAVKIIGSDIDKKKDMTFIKNNFLKKVEKYSDITVESLIFENIKLGFPKEDMALVELKYRFYLISKIENLPIIEGSREIYIMKKINNNWKIFSNYDHFNIIGNN